MIYFYFNNDKWFYASCWIEQYYGEQCYGSKLYEISSYMVSKAKVEFPMVNPI